MRLVDANILMYASFDAFPQHEKARKWLVLASADTDFARFTGLRLENPVE